MDFDCEAVRSICEAVMIILVDRYKIWRCKNVYFWDGVFLINLVLSGGHLVVEYLLLNSNCFLRSRTILFRRRLTLSLLRTLIFSGMMAVVMELSFSLR